MASRFIYECGCASCGDVEYLCEEHRKGGGPVGCDDNTNRDSFIKAAASMVDSALTRKEEALNKRLVGESRTPLRTFDTGATRDSEAGKHDYEGFNSPLVEKRFAEYMTQHRVQSDGSLRASDNWQKGIPIEAYMKSLLRHVHDLWLHYDGYPEEAVELNIESILSAIRFNVNGYLLEVLKAKKNAHK